MIEHRAGVKDAVKANVHLLDDSASRLVSTSEASEPIQISAHNK